MENHTIFHGGGSSGNCPPESSHSTDGIAHLSGFFQCRSKPPLMRLMKQQILLQWSTKEAYNIIHYFKNLHTWNKCLVCPLFVQLIRQGKGGEENRWIEANADFEGLWNIGKGRCLDFVYNYTSVPFEIIIIKMLSFCKRWQNFFFLWIYLHNLFLLESTFSLSLKLFYLLIYFLAVLQGW